MSTETETAPQARLIPDRRQDYHLVNAERESRRRGLFDVPIVDCDSHCYETSSLPEIVRYMENPNIRRSFEVSSAEFIQATVIPQNLGERTVGGRLKIGGGTSAAKGVHPLEAAPGDLHPVAATTLRSMDAMGIDYTILFPTPMLNLGIHPDQDVQNDLAWAFNRWLTEDVISCDDRLLTMPYLPIGDPDRCVRFIGAFAERPGVLGFMVTCLQYQPLHRNAYMKVFAALNERSLPIAFHSGPNWVERPFTVLGRFLGAHALGFPFYAMVQLTNVVLSGLPERFPNIRWIFMEAGQAWVPFTIARLDNEYKQRSAEAPLLTRLPGDYIRDMYFTTQPFETHQDPGHTRAMLDMMNAPHSLLYASDYPHQDFDTPAVIDAQRCLTDAEKRAILGGNALRLFNLAEPDLGRKPEAAARARDGQPPA
jgi:predicted TIM-barrel fold metal-dependent hydrolase